MSKSADSLLSFNDFENYEESAEISVNSPKKVTFNDEKSPSTPPLARVSMFQIEYYQQFFNIDTMEVVDRIAYSVIPKRASSTYLKTHLGVNPDLYGPFWITVTLIFVIGISGNLAAFFQHDHSSEFTWHYNFHLVSYASSCIIMYICVMPIALWAVLRWSVDLTEEVNLDIESSPYVPSLLSIVCLYGYSLAVYVPVSILWTIQISLLQWLLVLTAAFLSGSVLINILMPSLRLSKYSFFLIIGIASAHFLLAAGFMLYFFHVPSTPDKAPIVHQTSGNITG